MTAPEAAVGTHVVIGSFEHADPASPAHRLVRAFRGGDASIRGTVLATARGMIMRDTALREGAWVVVPVPPHAPAAGTRPLDVFAAELAATPAWDADVSTALTRVLHVPEAKRRGPRDPRSELRSLAWRGPSPEPGQRLLLVDDVLASGLTATACLGAIRRHGIANEVHLMVIARAQ